MMTTRRSRIRLRQRSKECETRKGDGLPRQVVPLKSLSNVMMRPKLSRHKRRCDGVCAFSSDSTWISGHQNRVLTGLSFPPCAARMLGPYGQPRGDEKVGG